ncbi:PD-(D/E)XK nuclease family protein [Tuberibacillus sp. Marseille-P3662]|uniref:PD-(D/E)XK nuclease family protein n=1 Tax=Tuberibacillus sp. Marseille-P3662 TaxID=1965358 RepID=UPI000A1C7CB5|nr:PD-(D/E)XK nuclease family protein [Tuberibacillus sp. Marseille-P3662]
MGGLMEALHKICLKHPFVEKRLLARTHREGRQLVESYVSDGYQAVNLHVYTLADVMEEMVAETLFHNDWKVVNEHEAVYLVFQCLQKCGHTGELTYFHRVEPTLGLARSIYTAISDLKQANVHLSEWPENASVHPDKWRDLQIIDRYYHQALKNTKKLDQGDLVDLALKKGQPLRRNVTYIIAPNHKFSRQEQALYDRWIQPDAVVLPTFVVVDPETPTHVVNENRYAYMYHPELAIKRDTDPDVRFFHAYGESNELRHILSEIRSQKHPLDDVTIAIAGGESYTPLLYQLTSQYQIPVTFNSGYAIHNTRPGRLLHQLLNWIEQDYSDQMLLTMIRSSEFDVKHMSLTKRALAKGVKHANIGWGKTRYVRYVNQVLNDDLSKRDKSVIDSLWTMIHDLPETGSQQTVDVSHFSEALSQWLELYAAIKDAADGEALEALMESLAVPASGGRESIQLEDAIQLMRDVTSGLSVQAAASQPGHLHVTRVRDGLFDNREITYIVGLDQTSVPGQVMENPVLLDAERQRISQYLPLSTDHLSERHQASAQYLATRIGESTLSYSMFDMNDHRKREPASFMLQAYRLAAMQLDADYQVLADALGTPAGFIAEPDGGLDTGDEWLSYALENDSEATLSQLRTNFPLMASGFQAAKARRLPQLTPYDGNIHRSAANLDPRMNKELVMSTEKLQTLATCPYQYFLRYVLRLKPKEVRRGTSDEWLDPLQRGELLHRIFEHFYRSIMAKNESTNETHRLHLFEWAENQINEQRMNVPPPSDWVFALEKDELLAACDVFLQSEMTYADEGDPVAFEWTFGLDDERAPAAIDLGDTGQFRLAGKIDRIDKLDAGDYRIIDYKTGSAKRYGKHDYFKGGRQLQHALYGLALEAELADTEITGSVRDMAYLFPTLKGEGERVYRTGSKREETKQVLNTVFDLTREGLFPVTDDAHDCTFCDFKHVCRRSAFADSVKAKMADDTRPELIHFKRMRDNE